MRCDAILGAWEFFAELPTPALIVPRRFQCTLEDGHAGHHEADTPEGPFAFSGQTVSDARDQGRLT